MKVKKSKRLLKELAATVDNPAEFIYGVMALQNQSADDIIEKVGITKEHFHVIINYLRHGKSSIGPKIIYNISTSLDIPPTYLNRVVADHKLKLYIKSLESC